MVSLIRKAILGNSEKNNAAPYIFIVLCAFTALTTAYTQLFFGAAFALVRFALGVAIVAVFVIIERSPLSNRASAFLSPAIVAAILIFGAIYFEGDGLLFIYINCISLISLTYFNAKGLAAYIITSTAAIAAILFFFNINLLGGAFTFVYNCISFMASFGLNVLVYTFCIFCVKMLNALTEAKNEATLAALAKGSFLANMSHEIRTPLNAIIGLTEAELRKDKPESDLANLRKIHSSGNHLISLINDILDMSKIESGKFELDPTEYTFADLIYETVTLNMVRIGSKPVNFLVSVDESIPSRLSGDELRIKQLLSNMLSNAFKYTKEGSVELKVAWRTENDGARLIFSVADTGIGIRPEDLKKIFSEYAQVNQKSTRGIEGTGLGLAICKGLAELMGGGLSAKSAFGEGSVFTADIKQGIVDEKPLGPDIALALKNFTYIPEYGEPGIEYTPLPNVRVLVVDDVEVNREVAACCLEPYEIKVDCIDNGYSAVQRIKDGTPVYDLVFMDHMMPGMDGIAATQAIREIGTDYAVSIPIIALTANALAGNEKMFTDNGFQGFLAKPIETQKLDAVIHRWCITE